jgi:hypothetical protein
VRSLALIIFVAIFLTARAQQNLVINPSFESTLSCPGLGADWSSCKGWNNVNMNVGPGMWGTPDYFHPCGTNGTAPPNTFAGTCTAQDGNAFMAAVFYNSAYTDAREYLSSKMLCTMRPGNTYTVSFWITNGAGVKSPYTIRNVGIVFSAVPLTQSGFSLINGSPQCEVTSNIASQAWVQYTFAINPTTNWDYLTIGNFRPDSSNNVTKTYSVPSAPQAAYANYFIDNIQVMAPEPLAAGCTVGLQKPSRSPVSLSPNPFQTAFQLRGDVRSVKIADHVGRIVYESEIISSEGLVTIAPRLAPGCYIVSIQTSEGIERTPVICVE